VRGYLAAIAERDYQQAYELISADNPFPSVCAWICLHPCEESCRRGRIDAPVDIRGLKRFAVENAEIFSNNRRVSIQPTGKSVAVIGSGPAGLTAANDLTRLGHKVTIYDRHREPGGHFMASLPLFRLPRQVLRRDVEGIMAAGIDFVPETEVGRDVSIAQLKEANDAVIVSTGLWGGRKIDKPGFDHPDVLLALPFLEKANQGDNSGIGQKVAVIGGGNVAMDVARAAVRLGAAQVTVISLESREEMPASPWEIAETLAEGVKLCPGFGPSMVQINKEQITGLQLQQVEQVFDAEGRFNPVFSQDSYITIQVDSIILSIGQTPETGFLQGSSLGTDLPGYLNINKEMPESGAGGIFAAGEIVTGPGPAIAAVASGHRVAVNVHRYLSGETFVVPVEEIEPIGVLPDGVSGKVPPKERRSMPLLTPGERILNFLPYQAGLDEAAAQWEARRCLSCGLGASVNSEKCAGCLTCKRVCPYSAPDVGEYANVSPEKCLVCGICAAHCPAGAIIMGGAAENGNPDDIAGEHGACYGNAAMERDKDHVPAESGKTTVFVCRGVCGEMNYASLFDDVTLKEKVLLVEIPTAGALRLEWILSAFENMAAGVTIIGCATGKCRHPADSANCFGVFRRAQVMLEQLGISPEKLSYCQPDE